VTATNRETISTCDTIPGDISRSLWEGLLAKWPALFALVTSSAVIMWMNHHNVFTQIKRIDTTMLFLNGLLLFFVELTPFTTLLISLGVAPIE
jgi:uncharacterized membrane protein